MNRSMHFVAPPDAPYRLEATILRYKTNSSPWWINFPATAGGLAGGLYLVLSNSVTLPIENTTTATRVVAHVAIVAFCGLLVALPAELAAKLLCKAMVRRALRRGRVLAFEDRDYEALREQLDPVKGNLTLNDACAWVEIHCFESLQTLHNTLNDRSLTHEAQFSRYLQLSTDMAKVYAAAQPKG
ncbi:MAG TPA: hypothetical protein VFO38_02715 [Candidatus Saccharimonadales bacterium]|nr:hypothetical protein [Candidatus Saccharimonadales bacterium]